METLSDLTLLSEFEGTRVPAAPLNGPCLSLFGQILTHPSRVTFPWAPLRHALYTYFASPPADLDPQKIGAGWCGLSLILTAFKRLEVVESLEETNEVLSWLTALKIAAVRRSLAFEITTVTTLQDVLSNLLEPVPAEELQVARSRHNSTAASLPPFQKPVASTPSLSFERGSDTNTRSPSAGGGGGSPGVGDKRAGRERGESPAGKKRRSESFGQTAGGGQRGRVSDVSTSALGSFAAEFSDQHDIDPLDLSSSDSEGEDDDEDEYVVGSGSRAKKGSRSGRSSHVGTPSGVAGPPAGTSDRAKVNSLAARLAEVTGIPLAKCIDTLSRFPDEDLSAINPNAPIPPQFLPPGLLPPQPSSSSSHSKPTTTSSGSSNKKKSSTKIEIGPDGQPIKKTTRTQRPHDPNRPNFSYSALIGQAILNAPGKRLRLAEIYEFVTNNYAYYKKNECGWQNSIRHNLSLQPVFKKIPDIAMPGKKGCFWTIIESEEWRFAGGGWMKMEKGQPGHGVKKSGHGGGGGGGGGGVGGGGKKAGGGASKSKGKSNAAGMKLEEDGEEDGGGDQFEMSGAGGGNTGELYSEEED